MSTFLERLKLEARELEDKIFALTAFLETSTFENLSLSNKILLKKQLKAMEDYFSILVIRLEILSKLNPKGLAPRTA